MPKEVLNVFSFLVSLILKAFYKGRTLAKGARAKSTLKLHNKISDHRSFDWYRKWHQIQHHRRLHAAVLAVYMLSLIFGVFNYPQDVKAAWNYSKTWTTKSDFETGTTLTNVATSGDNDAGDLNGNDRLSLTSQAEERQTIAAGGGHSMVIKTDGTLWATGDNLYGQLGVGDNMYRNTWTQAPITDVLSVSALVSFSLVLKNDGTVWGAGYNSNGEIGDGSTVSRASFSQARVSASEYLTNVRRVVACGNHSLAVNNNESR